MHQCLYYNILNKEGFMKRFICILVIFLQTCLMSNAQTMTFMNNTYELKQIQKNSSDYVNEYLSSSNDKIYVNYLPKEDNEFDYMNNFISNVNNNPQLNLIGFYPEINSFSFGIVSGKKDSGAIVYNLIRCSHAKRKGIYVVQYTHIYPFTDKASFDKAFAECMTNNLKYADALSKTQIPEIIKKQK